MTVADDLATLPPLPDEIVAAIARVATNGTIVCSCCNASDVTDDDHRPGCPVWTLRLAISRELARVEAEIARLERERETARKQIGVVKTHMHGRAEHLRERAEAAEADAAHQRLLREDAEAEIARLKDGLREIAQQYGTAARAVRIARALLAEDGAVKKHGPKCKCGHWACEGTEDGAA